jgi:hypothetical protein
MRLALWAAGVFAWCWGPIVQESAQITFKPLYGADSKHDPLCFLLVVDDVTILLDCGWDERFNLDTIAPLIAYVRKGDCFALVLGTPSVGPPPCRCCVLYAW